jgi:DNA-binding beta-propeller fold protein YncE
MNHHGGTVSLVDANKLVVTKTISVGGELEAGAPSGDGQLFVNVASKHAIAVLDLVAGKVKRLLVMKGCTDPSGLAYDAADGLVASVCSNGVTKILRATDGAEVATLSTGKGSDGLIFDPNRKLLFVPAGEAGTLAVIGMSGDKPPTLLQTVKTAASARLGALDSKTGRLYLPVAKLGPPVPPEPWPRVRPGTFAFLVIGEK